MISTSTVVIRTEIAPRWTAILGFALACVLLVGSYYMSWTIAVLPLWVFLLSIHILIHNFRKPQRDNHAGSP
jgi:L-asparagine transporter-like permease